MKCKYCNKKAEWNNPYNNTNLCTEHAKIKMEELRTELNQPFSDTLKDWFLKIVEPDENLINISLDTKTGTIIKDANNSGR